MSLCTYKLNLVWHFLLTTSLSTDKFLINQHHTATPRAKSCWPMHLKTCSASHALAVHLALQVVRAKRTAANRDMLPDEVFQRIRGALFFGAGFKVTRNKLLFRDNLQELLAAAVPGSYPPTVHCGWTARRSEMPNMPCAIESCKKHESGLLVPVSATKETNVPSLHQILSCKSSLMSLWLVNYKESIDLLLHFLLGREAPAAQHLIFSA